MNKLSEDFGSNTSASFAANAPEKVRAVVIPGIGNLEDTLNETPFKEAKRDFSINIDEFCID